MLKINDVTIDPADGSVGLSVECPECKTDIILFDDTDQCILCKIDLVEQTKECFAHYMSNQPEPKGDEVMKEGEKTDIPETNSEDAFAHLLSQDTTPPETENGPLKDAEPEKKKKKPASKKKSEPPDEKKEPDEKKVPEKKDVPVSKETKGVLDAIDSAHKSDKVDPEQGTDEKGVEFPESQEDNTEGSSENKTETEIEWPEGTEPPADEKGTEPDKTQPEAEAETGAPDEVITEPDSDVGDGKTDEAESTSDDQVAKTDETGNILGLEVVGVVNAQDVLDRKQKNREMAEKGLNPKTGKPFKKKKGKLQKPTKVKIPANCIMHYSGTPVDPTDHGGIIVTAWTRKVLDCKGGFKQQIFYGAAYCSPKDRYTKHIGKKMAIDRMKSTKQRNMVYVRKNATALEINSTIFAHVLSQMDNPYWSTTYIQKYVMYAGMVIARISAVRGNKPKNPVIVMEWDGHDWNVNSVIGIGNKKAKKVDQDERHPPDITKAYADNDLPLKKPPVQISL